MVIVAAVRFGDTSDAARDDVFTFTSGGVFNQLMQFCIRQLGVSWSDTSQHGRERELTTLQLLVNGCWMDAVQWLAKECNAPLQGIVIEGSDYLRSDDIEPFRATLRTLQDEQQRAWAGMGGDVADTE